MRNAELIDTLVAMEAELIEKVRNGVWADLSSKLDQKLGEIVRKHSKFLWTTLCGIVVIATTAAWRTNAYFEEQKNYRDNVKNQVGGVTEDVADLKKLMLDFKRERDENILKWDEWRMSMDSNYYKLSTDMEWIKKRIK